MSQGWLTLLTGGVALVTGLATAKVQSDNHALAGHLDEMTRECAWLERCKAAHEKRITKATFETELWIQSTLVTGEPAPAEPVATPAPSTTHQLEVTDV